MAHLLVVGRLQAKALRAKSNVPLMLEYEVHPETAPYLVSSSSATLWVNELHPGNRVKTAIREVTVGAFYAEVVEAVVAMGTQMKWGNVHPLTVQGVRDAVDHVESYDLSPVELLIPRAHPPGSGEPEESRDGVEEGSQEAVDLMPPALRPLIDDLGIPFRPCSWMPANTIVVVPKERGFVGTVTKVGSRKLSGLVHNAARGIAVARIQDELAG